MPETTVWALVTSCLTVEAAGSVFVAGVFLDWDVSNNRYPSDITHVKYLDDLVEVQPPRDNLFLIALCAKILRNQIPFSLLDDIPMDLRRNPRFR